MQNSSGNDAAQQQGVLFSVVIPAYNSAPFIAKALDSVRAQTLTDYEVVITNDGSKDETVQVIEEYARRHPDYPVKLASQQNKGIGGARNNGIFRSTGRFIAFLDADDFWHPTKLERMAALLTQKPLIDVAYHDEIEVASDGTRRPLSYDEVRAPAYQDLLFRGNRLSTSATVVRRELAQAIGGFSENLEFNSAEDYEFWLRLARAGARFAHLPEVLGEYHRVEGSITQKIEYHHRNIFNVVSYHLELLRADGTCQPAFLDRMYRRKKAEHLATLGRALAGAGAKAEGLRVHWEAMRVDPLCLKIYTKLVRTLLS
ncbi:glycosyltransferase [Geomonas subterranea]|uniref:Glycosyltransferase n=1 Tax=Geomonas subterranea TaxID=2847989 RepID=A0ABX8LFZ6_9BACT|nr:glycosyltransferase [Geomonas subterranea]QXE90602.1 glycosyltransferase [Geomonas subterranea]QXM11318.1 glycosyltransferase [Geomonas subterranea]